MIIVSELFKRYGQTRVFEGFSCTFDTNAFTALTGPSGSGKTTLLRLIAGLEKPDRGVIAGIPERFGTVFAEPRLFAHLTALENVALFGAREQAERILCALGLAQALGKRPHELSGGMRQRVAIARALIYGKDFVLLDEPFHALDGQLRGAVMSFVKENARAGILITHHPEEAEFFAKGNNLHLTSE